MYVGKLNVGDLVRVRLDPKVRRMASQGGGGRVPEVLVCRVTWLNWPGIGRVTAQPVGRFSAYVLNTSREHVLDKLAGAGVTSPLNNPEVDEDTEPGDA